MADAERDDNQITTLLAVSTVDDLTPVKLWADPVTHRLLVDSGVSFADSEQPSETPNDVITDFELSNTPTSGSLHVYLNGVRQNVATDFTLSGTTVTFNEAPVTTSIILFDYRF